MKVRLKDDININIEKDNNKFWFSILNDDNSTCKKPFCYISKDSLIELKKEIEKLLKD